MFCKYGSMSCFKARQTSLSKLFGNNHWIYSFYLDLVESRVVFNDFSEKSLPCIDFGLLGTKMLHAHARGGLASGAQQVLRSPGERWWKRLCLELAMPTLLTLSFPLLPLCCCMIFDYELLESCESFPNQLSKVITWY